MCSNQNRCQIRLNPSDPKYGDFLRDLLDTYVEASSESEMDDSNEDPDYVLPSRKG